tara:strand:- start:3 stop:833 length:831 start_codon:yes stop_codon:yes gene_type:complete
MIAIIALLIIIYLLTLHEIQYSNKIKQSINKGYDVTISRLPDYGSKDDYLYYFKLLNDLSCIDSAKISLKVKQLGQNKKEQLKNFIDILTYARDKNIFVWISSTLLEFAPDEMFFYDYAISKGFTNIGITLSTNNPNINRNVDYVLKKGGHIRLVKGYYYTYLTKNWKKVSELFRINAKKLLNSNNYHVIATHDFEILTDLYEQYNLTSNWSNIEFGFFYSSLNFITYMIKKTRIIFPKKSLYIPYGPFLNYTIDNVPYLDWQHIIMRKIKSLFYL